MMSSNGSHIHWKLGDFCKGNQNDQDFCEGLSEPKRYLKGKENNNVLKNPRSWFSLICC